MTTSVSGTLRHEHGVALLGATGSIGRQAIEIVDAEPRARALRAHVGHAAARRARGRARRPTHVQVGGSADDAARGERARRRAECDRRLRRRRGDAVGARARRHARAREQGEPRRRRRARPRRAPARGGGLLLPVDSEHSALFQCLEGRDPETVESLVLTASGRAVPRPHARRARARDVAEALAHPTWSMGRKITVDSATLANKGLELIEAHWLFGIPYEPDRGRRPPDLGRALARPLPGRRRCSHTSGSPDMRVPISFALTYPERAAVARRAARSRRRARPPFRGARRRDVPAAARSRARPASAAARSRARTTRRTRSPSRRSSRRGSASPRSPTPSQAVLEQRRRRPGARSRRPRRGRCRGTPRAARRLVTGMTILVAIVGLGLLVFVHELGHFRLAGPGDAAAEVLHRLPACRS